MDREGYCVCFFEGVVRKTRNGSDLRWVLWKKLLCVYCVCETTAGGKSSTTEATETQRKKRTLADLLADHAAKLAQKRGRNVLLFPIRTLEAVCLLKVVAQGLTQSDEIPDGTGPIIGFDHAMFRQVQLPVVLGAKMICRHIT